MKLEELITKSYNRKLITEPEFKDFIKTIDDIGVKLNNYINSVGKSISNEWQPNDNWMTTEWQLNDNWMTTEWQLNDNRMTLNDIFACITTDYVPILLPIHRYHPDHTYSQFTHHGNKWLHGKFQKHHKASCFYIHRDVNYCGYLLSSVHEAWKVDWENFR